MSEYIIKKNKSGTIYVNPENFKIAYLLNDGTILKGKKEIFDFCKKNRIPLKVKFEITGNCNFNCYFCYARSLKYKSSLNLKDIKKILDKLEKIGIVFLELTGGEPLIRKDLFEILKYIKNKKFILTILTNGYFLNDKLIEELKKVNLFSLYISLLSPIESHCDKLTGVPGSYRTIINNIKKLTKSNIPIQINASITNENVDEIDFYSKLKKSLNIHINFAIDVGPEFNDVERNFKYIIKKEKYNNIKKIFPELKEIKLSCGAAQSHFLIDQNGNLLPCIKYREVIGNLLYNDFFELWNSAKLKFILKKDFYNGKVFEKCETCMYKDYCHYCAGEVKTYRESNKGEYLSQLCYKPKQLFELYNKTES